MVTIYILYIHCFQKKATKYIFFCFVVIYDLISSIVFDFLKAHTYKTGLKHQKNVDIKYKYKMFSLPI